MKKTESFDCVLIVVFLHQKIYMDRKLQFNIYDAFSFLYCVSECTILDIL